jgi:hypothetical protein
MIKPEWRFMDKAKERKETPIYTGVLMYFPDAIREIAQCSYAGQQQHNPYKALNGMWYCRYRWNKTLG